MSIRRIHGPQIAMGTGFSLFLVDPEHDAVKALDVWEPAEATCEPANTEAAADAGRGRKIMHASVSGSPSARYRRPACRCGLFWHRLG